MCDRGSNVHFPSGYNLNIVNWNPLITYHGQKFHIEKMIQWVDSSPDLAAPWPHLFAHSELALWVTRCSDVAKTAKTRHEFMPLISWPDFSRYTVVTWPKLDPFTSPSTLICGLHCIQFWRMKLELGFWALRPGSNVERRHRKLCYPRCLHATAPIGI